jgi:hypothetical protein
MHRKLLVGNAKVALARFALDKTHRERVRELHGMELLGIRPQGDAPPRSRGDSDDDDGDDLD